MMELDGVILQLQDIVYDLSNGYGRVTDIDTHNFTVLFGNRRRITFMNKGKIGGVRRLFWHDPLILAPPKDLAEWEHLIRLVVSIKSLIATPPKP